MNITKVGSRMRTPVARYARSLKCYSYLEFYCIFVRILGSLSREKYKNINRAIFSKRKTNIYILSDLFYYFFQILIADTYIFELRTPLFFISEFQVCQRINMFYTFCFLRRLCFGHKTKHEVIFELRTLDLHLFLLFF